MATVIKVTWAANPASEQVTSYKVFESKDGGAFNFKSEVTSPEFQVANPLPGVYAYKVTAHNLAGASVESDPASTSALPTKPATPVVEVIIT